MKLGPRERKSGETLEQYHTRLQNEEHKIRQQLKGKYTVVSQGPNRAAKAQALRLARMKPKKGQKVEIAETV